MLVQRAVSEDPRWTRAVGDHLARAQMGKVEERLSSDARSEGQSGGSFGEVQNRRSPHWARVAETTKAKCAMAVVGGKSVVGQKGSD